MNVYDEYVKSQGGDDGATRPNGGENASHSDENKETEA